MKFTYKRMLSLAVVLVMVLSMLPATSLATDFSQTCSHCKSTPVWEKFTGTVESGKHYYFEAEEGESKVTLTSVITVAAGQTVCFDLNGQVVQAKANSKAFDNAGTLHIQDTAETKGWIKGYGSTSGSNGGLGTSSGTLSLKDVTLTYCKTAYYGGILAITGGTATITGGEISSGTSTKNAGGNVYITGGTSTFTDVKIKNGSAATSTKSGGNLHVTGGTVNLNNCDLIGGTAGKYGDNIYVGGGTVNVNAGSSIDGGKTTLTDFYAGANGTLNIYAGVTTYWRPATYMKDCTGILTAKDENQKTTYETYADFNAAYAALESGKTVLLTQNETVGGIELEDGEAINLYGFTLTASSLDTTLGGVISDGQGGGKVAVTGTPAFGDAQLPISVEGGYVFETVTGGHKLIKVSDNEAKYSFYFAKNDEETFLKEAVEAGTASVKVSINYDGVTQPVLYEIGLTDLQTYAGKWDTSLFVLSIKGVEGKTNLTCGVVVTANGVDYAITPAGVAQQ